MRCRAERASQRGGALLALVLALLGGGGTLWLASAFTVSIPGVEESRRRLLDARRALLAHVSAYPESYGAAGAGPGHLPCPDTDTPLDSDVRPPGHRTPSASDPFRGDGPDPPCGSGALALGHLPRHVSLPSHRELFHRERTQRFVYAVSTRFINNPPNRVINPDSGGASEGEGRNAVVALIVDIGDTPLPAGLAGDEDDPLEVLERLRIAVRERAGPQAAALIEHVTVDRATLLATAGRRVAAWFVETATRVARRRCPPARDAVGTECPRWPEVDRSCVLPEGERPLEWLTDDPLPASRALPDGCAETEPASPPKTLENTPLERHWFVRNGWHRFVTLEVDDACRHAAASCALHLVRSDTTMPSIRLAPPARGARP